MVADDMRVIWRHHKNCVHKRREVELYVVPVHCTAFCPPPPPPRFPIAIPWYLYLLRSGADTHAAPFPRVVPTTRLDLPNDTELLVPLAQREHITARRRKHRAASRRRRAELAQAAKDKEALALAEAGAAVEASKAKAAAEGTHAIAGDDATAAATGDSATANHVGDGGGGGGGGQVILKRAKSVGVTMRLDARGVEEDYFGDLDTSLGYVCRVVMLARSPDGGAWMPLWNTRVATCRSLATFTRAGMKLMMS